MFAILSVWIALGALVTTVLILFRQDASVEIVITLLPYTIALSATLAAGVLWALRRRGTTEPGVAGQRVQATAALVLDSLSFAILLFALQDVEFAVVGLIVEFGFLGVCWWIYTRVLVPDDG